MAAADFDGCHLVLLRKRGGPEAETEILDHWGQCQFEPGAAGQNHPGAQDFGRGPQDQERGNADGTAAGPGADELSGA